MLIAEYLRRKRGETQAQVAQAALVPRARVSELECGRWVPNVHSVPLKRIADALGWDMADAGALLEEVADEPPA